MVCPQVFRATLNILGCSSRAHLAIILAGVVCMAPCAGFGQEHRAPDMGVNSGFMSGPAPRRLAQMASKAIGSARDAIRPRDVTISDNDTFAFDRESARRVRELDGKGVLSSLILLARLPGANQSGETVLTPDDVAAFGRYVAAVAGAFPGMLLEIGNEFNGNTFIKGAALQLGPAPRAELHARILAAIADAGVPRDRILGGAAHSIAAGYLWAMLDAGAADHMSAVTIHPYTSQPEAYARQIAVLRRHPAMAGLAVDFTEFGSQDQARSADFFWRAYCSMAEAGVRRAQWYPLEFRHDGYVPVLDVGHALTPVGRALLHARTRLAGRAVTVLDLGPFARGCLFDDRLAVLWGEPRALSVTRPDLLLRHADLLPRKDHPPLDPQRVILVEAPDGTPPINPATDLVPGPTDLVADSFLQFDYPGDDNAPPGGLLRLIRDRTGTRPLDTCPGQDRPQAPWFPYLCDARVKRAVLHDRGFVLGGNAQDRSELILSLPVTEPARLEFAVDTTMQQGSDDGIVLSIEVDGVAVATQPVHDEAALVFGPFDVDTGNTVALIIAPGANPAGDAGLLRLRVYDRSE